MRAVRKRALSERREKELPELAAKLAALGDIYVMDAFATAHRAQASTEGAIRAARTACAGLLMAAELDAVTRILHEPARPLLAIIGGSKVSTKLEVLENLSRRVDQLIVGGGIANTFLKAAGFEVGTSLYEPDLLEASARIMADAAALARPFPACGRGDEQTPCFGFRCGSSCCGRGAPG